MAMMTGTTFGLNIYQPLLFLGLGGTGCAIGTELERRLRQTLCGPDGTAFSERMAVHGNSSYLPHQLPGCVQFVYADLNEAELDRIHGATVPGPADHQVAARNAHLVRGLVPRFRTYQELADNLRLAASPHIASWLPPEFGEPRVSPITKGAGQLPTVGRAALFETVRDDMGPVQRPLRMAIDAISRSNAELGILGGRNNQTCDVFVAFSVAGGTGAGIFYDFLHLVADAFTDAGIGVQIYPLVLMPSAFGNGQGGGRSAQLNGGRALLDLFRLIDDQNARRNRQVLGDIDQVARPVDVAYPNKIIEMVPGTAQTAFLFTGTAGMNRDDIHRSMASLVLSLITAEQAQDKEAQAGQKFQSFADSFINAAATRGTPADSGVGYRGVSTGLVASLTVPGDDLAELVAGRLLARAIPQLDLPSAGGEQNVPLVMRMAQAANLDEVLSRPDLPVGVPRMVDGAAEIKRSLTDHSDGIGAVLRAQAQQVDQVVQEIAGQRLQPLEAAKVMLGEVDIFRLQRVLRGHSALLEPRDKVGLLGLLEARKNAPPQPPNDAQFTAAAPPLPVISKRRTKWGDPQVQQALALLRGWHQWNTWRLWHEGWGRQSRVWQPKVGAAVTAVDAFAEALRVFARGENAEFERRSIALGQERTGIRQLLPAGGNLDAFYNVVLRCFLQRDGHPEGAAEADVVRVLLPGRDWQQAFAEITERNARQRAVTSLRDRLKQQVKQLFEEAEGSDVPLLPSMGRLLARAASPAALPVNPIDLRTFSDQVRALLPGGFSPQGSGALRILIAHPDVKQVGADEVRRHLERELALPTESGQTLEFRPGQADSIVVVLFRTSMAINEVREVRELLKYWSEALRANDHVDFLGWRQRLGHQFGWLLLTEENRALILHRLMCAMWNGQVTVEGSMESPTAVLIRAVDYAGARPMRLSLQRLERTSSWGTLLPAYERWTIEDDSSAARQQFMAALRTIEPKGLTNDPQPPADIYRVFVKVAHSEVARLEQYRDELPPTSRARAEQLLEFWRETFPAAESRPFGQTHAVRGNLRDLFEYLPPDDLMDGAR